jgi:hypothetical protein
MAKPQALGVNGCCIGESSIPQTPLDASFHGRANPQGEQHKPFLPIHENQHCPLRPLENKRKKVKNILAIPNEKHIFMRSKGLGVL